MTAPTVNGMAHSIFAAHGGRFVHGETENRRPADVDALGHPLRRVSIRRGEHNACRSMCLCGRVRSATIAANCSRYA
jgi:hypothetical protein